MALLARLSPTAARWAAWGVAGASAALLLAGAVAVLGGLSAAGPDARDWLAAVAFTLIGARVAERRPENPVGWLFLGIGLAGALAVWTAAGARVTALAWASQWVWWPAYALLPLGLLLFPSGRLLSARWRPAAWLAVVGLVVPTVCIALAALTQPTDLLTSGQRADGQARLALIVGAIGAACSVAAAVAAVAGLLVRYRRSHGDERQQCKWLLAGGAVATMSFGFEVAGAPGAWVVGAVAVPAAAGVAILRHRLYDIDRLVHRAVSYAIVSAVLATFFGGAVVVLRATAEPFTGSSNLAVAATTLLAAGAFRPLLRRVQAAVDRRFNRARYDAVATVEDFSRRLRDRVDLDDLADDLLATARTTMEPASASLWLRPIGPQSAAEAMGNRL